MTTNISLADRLLITLQRLLPARLLGRAVYHLTRIETGWFKDAFIKAFVWLYDVDTSTAELTVPEGYASFNAFFTRRLLADARQFETGPRNFLAPCDGTLAQSGRAESGRLIQAKGVDFSAADLLGDEALAKELADCPFTTIYLAPYDYHRLHMPIDGTLEQTLYIPGLLFSVNARTAASVPDLYAINERLVCQFRHPLGRFAMVLVGAMNVASISTAWGGEIPVPSDYRILRRRYTGANAPRLSQGEYMGHFNMGSTVVLLGPAGLGDWDAAVQVGKPAQVGQLLGTLDAQP